MRRRRSVLPYAICPALIRGSAVLATASASAVSWMEAEVYQSQRGSTAPKFAMPTASGGACVDNDWGGQTGHFLRYTLELSSDYPALHVTLPATTVVLAVLDANGRSRRELARTSIHRP